VNSDTTNDIGSRIERLRLDDILVDRSIQMRERPSADTVADYAEAMRNGATFPCVIVYQEPNGRRWLADGFHRHDGARLAGVPEIEAEVREGSRRDALLHAVGANAEHGLPRSRADKRKAVETLLRDPDWSLRSDREIARLTKTTHPFVGKVRSELAPQAGNVTSAAAPPPGGENKPVKAPAVTEAPSGNGQATLESCQKPRAVAPPPGAGDAWEPPEPGSEEAARYKEEMREVNADRDRLGNVLPPGLRDDFADTFYDDVTGSLRWMVKHILAGEKRYLRLRLYPDGKSVAQRLHELAEFFAAAAHQHRPFALCPVCLGKGCENCFTTGWMSKGEHEARLSIQPSNTTS
jgi:hypothetical protein